MNAKVAAVCRHTLYNEFSYKEELLFCLMLEKSLLGRRILNFAILHFVTFYDTRLSAHKQTETAKLRPAFGPTHSTKLVTGRVLIDKCYRKGTYR
jgi:hypothetical protein